jgi:acyl-coenzyme A thioesterase PaaI-like protein
MLEFLRPVGCCFVTDDLPLTRDDVLPANYRDCFVCGENNEFGIQLLDIRREGDVVRAAFMPKSYQQGFPNVMHGGIVFAVLDEVMAYACVLLAGKWAATAKTEVRFRKATPVDQELQLEGGITKGDGRRFSTWSKLLLADGTVMAEATGLFVPVPEDLFDFDQSGV